MGPPLSSSMHSQMPSGSIQSMFSNTCPPPNAHQKNKHAHTRAASSHIVSTHSQPGTTAPFPVPSTTSTSSSSTKVASMGIGEVVTVLQRRISDLTTCQDLLVKHQGGLVGVVSDMEEMLTRMNVSAPSVHPAHPGHPHQNGGDSNIPVPGTPPQAVRIQVTDLAVKTKALQERAVLFKITSAAMLAVRILSILDNRISTYMHLFLCCI